jgi:RNA polymerase sigma-70 factor, ECF subfamily
MGSEEHLLIKSAQEGDHQAFEALVKRYDAKVMSLIRSFIKNRSDAQDIYQEVFLRVYTGLKNFRLESSFFTWVYRITVNRCMSYFDQKSRKDKKHLNPWEDEETEGDWLERIVSQRGLNQNHSDEKNLKTRRLKKIWEAVETLRPKQRLIFCLRYQHGMRVKVISEIFDMPEGTVKILAFRAVRHIREYLEENPI